MPNVECMCTVTEGSVGPIHEEGPHMANCMACQCACKTSKDLADKILGGDSCTNIITDPKVKPQSAHAAMQGPKDESPSRQRSPPRHRRGQSPQRSTKQACQALFEARKENENFSQPGSLAHSPTKTVGRSKSPDESKAILENFGKTLEVHFIATSVSNILEYRTLSSLVFTYCAAHRRPAGSPHSDSFLV